VVSFVSCSILVNAFLRVLRAFVVKSKIGLPPARRDEEREDEISLASAGEACGQVDMESTELITGRTVVKRSVQVLLVLLGLVLVRLWVTSPVMIVGIRPGDLSVGVGPDSHIQIVFENPMDRACLNEGTLRLLDGDQAVATRVSYNAVSKTATIDASRPMGYGEKYTVVVGGGAEGVRSAHFGRGLESDYRFSFTTTSSPTGGPGGPILVLDSDKNPLSCYYAEILRAEGLNEFAVEDIGSVSSASLAGYKMVILGEVPVTDEQVAALESFVEGGGDLIAMRPDGKLAHLLGLRAVGGSESDAYVKIDNDSPMGAGLVNTPIQYHGAADLYLLDGARAAATLYSSDDTAMANPAVSVNRVGSGWAAAFTYDLARSVVETRQGNPGWSRQHRDGQLVGRSDDQLLGPARPSWMDRSKIAIPQADEQQRLLANLIEQMMLPILPMPRFWYLPDGVKAMMVMSGDDHDSGGVFGRWRNYAGHGESGGVPVGATAYVFPGKNLPDRIFAPLIGKGFEVALHVDVTSSPIFGSPADVPRDWTSYEELDSIYDEQLAIFGSEYPDVPSPTTNRTHGVVWSDFDSQPKVEFGHGIRMDCNYYYWPPTWINDQPGMFTGSGIPMRFVDSGGRMIDVFQESTVITDESGQTEPYFVDALLDAATGPQEAYGAFAVNAHTDEVGSPTADAVIVSAQAHGAPVVSTDYLLRFADGRDNSSFQGIAWNGDARTLTFRLSMAANSEGVDGMVPLEDSLGDCVTSISIDGKGVDFTKELVAGIYYARFEASSGAVVVEYSACSSKLGLTAVGPVGTAATNSAFTATFSGGIDAGRLSFFVRDFNGAVIPGSVTYDSGSRTATFTPAGVLRSGFPYTAVISALDDRDESSTVRAWTVNTAEAEIGKGAYSLWDGSSKPVCEDALDGKPVEVGVQFSSDVDGMVTGVRIYRNAVDTGTHMGRIWRDGRMLASATFSDETAEGWQTVLFDEPVAIKRGVVYVASCHTDTGNYAYTHDFFEGRGVDSGPLHALANSVASGGNGVYSSSGRFSGNEIGHPHIAPDETYRATNYWVDVIFVPLSGGGGG